MDRRERNGGNQQAGLLAMLEGFQSSVWTALPGIVQSFDAVKKTCVVQPALQAKVLNKDGSSSWVTLPLLVDCPVFFPSGGGLTLTFPIAVGNGCLVVFASRCIDSWWQSGGIQVQAELRMHDLSDGFVFVGVDPVPEVPAAISTTEAQLRTNDGLTYVAVNPNGNVTVHAAGSIGAMAAGAITAVAGGAVSVTAGGTISLTAPLVVVNGPLRVNGTITQTGGGASSVTGTMSTTGDFIAQGKSLATHIHGGVQNGGGSTNPPT